MSRVLTFELPWPPSVNTYWRNITVNGRGRTVISVAGRKYKREVSIRFHLATKMMGRLAVEIDAFPPDHRARDLDNLLKSLFDACTAAGVWGDDSQIDQITVKRGNVVENGFVVLYVREIQKP